MISNIWRGWENLLLWNPEIEQTEIISKKHLHIKKNTTRGGKESWPWLGKLRKGKMSFSSCLQSVADLYPEFQFLNSLIRCFDPCTLSPILELQPRYWQHCVLTCLTYFTVFWLREIPLSWILSWISSKLWSLRKVLYLLLCLSSNL